MRVGVTERIDGDAGVEIEISGSVLADQAHALAPLESEWRSGVGAVQRGHDLTPGVRCDECCDCPTKTKNALPFGARGAAEICLRPPSKSTFGAQVADLTPELEQHFAARVFPGEKPRRLLIPDSRAV